MLEKCRGWQRQEAPRGLLRAPTPTTWRSIPAKPEKKQKNHAKRKKKEKKKSNKRQVIK
jgi:hypothetical protein